MLRNAFDVYADLDHLFMLNFSVPANRLRPLVPPPLRLLTRSEIAYPSIVLPGIKRLRPARLGLFSVDYELMGLRLLVTYNSHRRGEMKGIYFARLILQPTLVRLLANMVTSFTFEPGRIQKTADGDRYSIRVLDGGAGTVVSAEVRVTREPPTTLTPDSTFAGAGEALAFYNDISFGFLPEASGIRLLQIADPHPNYQAWPLTHLVVDHVDTSGLDPTGALRGVRLQPEPSYWMGPLPRYWRWLEVERVERRDASTSLP